jgi:hypothetical protein
MSSKADKPPSPRTTILTLAILIACLVGFAAHPLIFESGWSTGQHDPGSTSHHVDPQEEPFLAPGLIQDPRLPPLHVFCPPAGLVIRWQAIAPLVPPPIA